MFEINNSHTLVKEYYGKELKSSNDLKTNACCTADDMDDATKLLLSNIHDEVLSKYYGCGLIKPELLEGNRVLDLGCGTGRDVYALSQLVGENGLVIGVDMTLEQLNVAQKHIDYHMNKFGYSQPNVKFIHGFIEELDQLGLEENSFDVIVSNCVINLSPFKQVIFDLVYKLLKPGGEFYFSDVYADRRINSELKNDKVLLGECLSGALYINDFRRMVQNSGFNDPRVVKRSSIAVEEKAVKYKLGETKFESVTHRLFKIDSLEDLCEDYGQSVMYKGTIEGFEHKIILDSGHTFEKGRMSLVCGNTYNILNESRYAHHFDFYGSFNIHFGLFSGCGNEAKDDVLTGCC